MIIGWTNTFNINSYHYYNMPKTTGNDLFITRLLYKNGTEAEVLKSYYYSDSLYHIDFNVKKMEIAIAKIFACSSGFTMNYYDNTRFWSTPFLTRIEDHLPYLFTNEIRRLSYFSLRIESFLLFTRH